MAWLAILEVDNDGSETSDSQYSHGSALRMAEASDAEKQSEGSRMALVELVIANDKVEFQEGSEV